MPVRTHDDPPSNWAGATPAGGDVYWSIDPDDPKAGPLVWHWCKDVDRWSCANARDHTIKAADPLTLSPSLLWACCNLHGWIEAGAWRAA